MIFDPMYFLILAPALLLAGWAQLKVKRAYASAQRYRSSTGISGQAAAQRILDANSLSRVGIEAAKGFLGDHYDPRAKVLRLSPDVYNGRDLAALGIAAHEAGHAIQDAHGYAPLKLRNRIVPLASVGSNFSMILFIAGMFMAGSASQVRLPDGSVQWGTGQYIMIAAMALFSVVVIFQLVNLPVEFDASRRARKILVSDGIIAPAEEKPVAKVLNAAALTYVAATLTAILTLVYLVIRSGLLGGRRS